MSSYVAWKVLCVLFVSPLVLSVARGAQTEAPSAEQILDRMAATYATCKSYHDTGVVETVFIEAGQNRSQVRPFTTAFVRPDRFRFEYCQREGEKEVDRYIVWRKGKEVRSWWQINNEVEKSNSLGLAIAGATGVSGGSAHTISALLLSDEIGGRRLTEMTGIKRIEDATIGKAECYGVYGRYPDNPMTVWIDKKTYLVRRIGEEAKFKDFQTLETTTYEPTVDTEVAEKLLMFDPPERK